MSSPGGSLKKDAPSAPRGWSRRRGARGRFTFSTLNSRQSTPQSTRVSPVQPRGTASSRPQSSSPQGQRGARGSSPFKDPLLNTSWAQQVQAEAARLTAEASKKEKKEQKKQESESSSGVEKQSVEKEKKKPQEEEMDTSEVVQEGSALQHDVNPSDWEPSTANTGETNKPTTQLEITCDQMATAGASMMKKKEEKEKALQRKKERMEAVVHFLEEYSRRRPLYTEPGGPLRVNPAPTSLMKKPNVTPHSTINVEPYTVEELTAHQFRTVFDYITTNNILRDRIRGIRIPDRETTPARPSDYKAVARIVHVLQTLLEIVQHTTQSFHNLAVILVRHQPFEIRYTHLMGWIHELTHSITSITVNRDQLQEIMLPRLFQWSQDLDYFRATLQLFGITEETFTEVLQHSSPVTAHATRMIRVMEAHQMVHFLNRRRVRVTQEDEQYRLDSRVQMPPPWPEEPESYIQTLR
ncbi:hypothetical protein OSTOST_15051 [Ostertagia ostertagi]